MPAAPVPDIVLEFDRVSVILDGKPVLKDVSFRVARAETKLVLGAAASGKSVLLKTALGLFRPASGRVDVFGRDISTMSEEEMYGVREKIGMVFQESALFDSLTVEDNVAYVFQEHRQLPEDEQRRRVQKALEFVELRDVMTKLPSELSGGMRRRVAIARAFVGEPPLMLYDSPTAGLDPVTAQAIITLIVKLGDIQNVSSLMVTHRLQDAYVLAEYYFDPETNRLMPAHGDGRHVDTLASFLVLREGEVVFDGKRDELMRSSDPYVRKFIA